jgi:acetylornithine deacetylase/succinyl-diaminopimelate desuccinylase-like protein
MGPLRPDQATFFSLYKELVETNTTLSVGNCTAAAERIVGHLKAAGFEDKDVTLFSVPSHPKEGGVVAVLNGTSNSAKPMLLLGHLDVVEAKREDWTRDPFTLIEEDGYFYGRGTSDMKAMDATWIDALMRFKHDGYHPKRTIKMALTCGEETTYAFNGAEWLAKNRPELISAAFALNEGGGGRTDGHGKLEVESIQVGEKAMQNYLLETINAGGHSSIPIRDNAIYEGPELQLLAGTCPMHFPKAAHRRRRARQSENDPSPQSAKGNSATLEPRQWTYCGVTTDGRHCSSGRGVASDTLDNPWLAEAIFSI